MTGTAVARPGRGAAERLSPSLGLTSQAMLARASAPRAAPTGAAGTPRHTGGQIAQEVDELADVEENEDLVPSRSKITACELRSR